MGLLELACLNLNSVHLRIDVDKFLSINKVFAVGNTLVLIVNPKVNISKDQILKVFTTSLKYQENFYATILSVLCFVISELMLALQTLQLQLLPSFPPSALCSLSRTMFLDPTW